MDIAKVLAQLREELDLIEKAIAALEQRERIGQRRGGRLLGLVTKRDEGDRMKVSSKRLGRPSR
jgi:BMFP domain-containing protein YqiC